MTADTNTVPSPDDLSAWKAASCALSERMVRCVRSAGLMTPGVLKQYFGSKDGPYLLEAFERLSVTQALFEWITTDYRPVFRSPSTSRKRKASNRRKPRKAARRGKTLAERMPAEGLPAAEAALLAALAKAYPTLYRVVGVAPGISTSVQDVLLGGPHLTIHDKSLTECVRPGLCVIARAYPAGAFHFFGPAGPALSEMLAEPAAAFLESLGVKFTPDGLRKNADKFGRLWGWFDRETADNRMPHLCNTDGDDLVWHTASFTVADERTVREALTTREDIDHDPEADEYLWFRYQGEDRMIPGDTLSLGRMRFVLDELVLDVNSAQRLAAARQWLEKIPGVSFLGAKTRDANDDFLDAADTPLDDRLGPEDEVEMTPELAADMQAMTRQYYIDWLDISVPALGGKTPRQMCRTQSGRRKVARMIRTIPDPSPDHVIDLESIQAEMRRELGLPE